jgi:hypothetical protein
MKRIITIATILFSIIASNAQEALNTVKLNFFSLAAKELSLQYERTLSDHMGVAVQVGYMFPINIPGKFFTDTGIAGSEGQNFQPLSGKFTGGFQVTPEFRYYFKGEGNKGFYIAPYIRWASYGMSMNAVYRKDSASPYRSYEWKGNYSLLHGGLMIGSQHHIGNHFTLDWWIIGVGAGKSKITMKATGDFSDLSQNEFQSDINDNLKNMPLIKDVSASLTPTEANLSIGLLGVGLRTGLCLGYRF